MQVQRQPRENAVPIARPGFKRTWVERIPEHILGAATSPADALEVLGYERVEGSDRGRKFLMEIPEEDCPFDHDSVAASCIAEAQRAKGTKKLGGEADTNFRQYDSVAALMLGKAAQEGVNVPASEIIKGAAGTIAPAGLGSEETSDD